MPLGRAGISQHGGDPDKMEPIPYKGNRPCFGRVTLGLVHCPESQVNASGVGGDSVGNYRAHVRSPGGEAGCQRHLDNGECGCGLLH